MDGHKRIIRGLSGIVFLLAVMVVFWLVRQTGNGVQSEGETAVSSTDITPTRQFTTTTSENGGELFNDLPLIEDYSLSPTFNPHTLQLPAPQHTFETYIVERGDTPGGIADSFGIEPETLLGGNPRLSQESSLLQTGIELIILPIDGVLHDVEPGDTLESLSQKYNVSIEEVIAYKPNNLEFPYRLYPETQIMIPGAVRELFVWTPPDLSSVTSNTSWEGAGVRPLVVGTGSFIFPVNSRNFTQYFWYGHPGVDIALAEGTPVYAADTGTVTYSAWNVYGYGNLIVVNHGNGYETFYAHLNGYNVPRPNCAKRTGDWLVRGHRQLLWPTSSF